MNVTKAKAWRVSYRLEEEILNGECLVFANNEKEAEQKAIELYLKPKITAESIRCFVSEVEILL